MLAALLIALSGGTAAAGPLLESARAAVEAAWSAPGRRLVVALAAAEPALPPGALQFTARPLHGAQPSARVNVWVDVSVNGGPVTVRVVPLAVQAWQPVLVSRHQLERGAAPVCTQFETNTRDVAQLGAVPAPGDCAMLMGRLALPLAAGSVLQAAHLEALPAVAAGSAVRLRMQDGAVRIELRARALRDGQPGQHIGVVAAVGGQTLTARVGGPGWVELVGR